MRRFVLVFALVLGLPWTAGAENWPGWRGPKGNGQSAEKDIPWTWSEKDNIRWKVKLPGPGNSSPIIWGNRVFLSQSLDAKGHRRALLCLDRQDGKILWQREVPYKDNEPTHGTNPFCSATPLTDGQRVIVSHGSAGIFCYDFNGKELWTKEVGKVYHIWGTASSPIFYGDLVILWCSPGERQFLLALDKKTGEKVWQHDEPGGKFGQDSKDWLGSWSTPIIVPVDGHDELILPVPNMVKGFDPKTGKELWHCLGAGRLAYTSAVAAEDGTILVQCGFHGPALAVKAGGKGDVTKTHRLWLITQKNPQRIGSAVIIGDLAYSLSAPGMAQCFELKTGKEIWGSQRAGGQCWSSMVLVDGKLLVSNDGGETYIFAASPKFTQLGRNVLKAGDIIRASIAVSDGELFIRSYSHLWCISHQKN